MVRTVFFEADGWVETPIARFDTLPVGQTVGPVIVENPFTTIVVTPGASMARLASGSIAIDPAD